MSKLKKKSKTIGTYVSKGEKKLKRVVFWNDTQLILKSRIKFLELYFALTKERRVVKYFYCRVKSKCHRVRWINKDFVKFVPVKSLFSNFDLDFVKVYEALESFEKQTDKFKSDVSRVLFKFDVLYDGLKIFTKKIITAIDLDVLERVFDAKGYREIANYLFGRKSNVEKRLIEIDTFVDVTNEFGEQVFFGKNDFTIPLDVMKIIFDFLDRKDEQTFTNWITVSDKWYWYILTTHRYLFIKTHDFVTIPLPVFVGLYDIVFDINTSVLNDDNKMVILDKQLSKCFNKLKKNYVNEHI